MSGPVVTGQPSSARGRASRWASRAYRWMIGAFVGAVCVAIAAVVAAATLPQVTDLDVLVVRSGSMEPAVATGGIVVVDRSAARPAVGEIGTFLTPGDDLVTHRVHGVDTDGYITKGDANATVDSGRRDPANVYGTVVGTVPFLGYVLAAFRQPPIFFGALVLGIGYLAWGELRVITQFFTRSDPRQETDVVAPT